eukprot:scpid100600/ scgid3331/ 
MHSTALQLNCNALTTHHTQHIRHCAMQAQSSTAQHTHTSLPTSHCKTPQINLGKNPGFDSPQARIWKICHTYQNSASQSADYTTLHYLHQLKGKPRRLERSQNWSQVLK